jgi:hypothetical protein
VTRRWLILALVSIAACRPAGAPTEERRGCRLDIGTHVAKCPCALTSDLIEMPDRPDLETLRVHFAVDADPRRLERLTHLRALEIAHPTPAQLLGVSTLTRIETLVLTTWDPPDLAPLAAMRQLRKLTIRNANEGEIDLTPLAGSSLHFIRIEGEPARLDGKEALGPDVELQDEVLDTRAHGGICDIDPSACPRLSDIEDWSCKEPVIYAVQ